MLNFSGVGLRRKMDARLVLVVGVEDERELNCFFDEMGMMNWMSRFAELMMNIHDSMLL